MKSKIEASISRIESLIEDIEYDLHYAGVKQERHALIKMQIDAENALINAIKAHEEAKE